MRTFGARHATVVLASGRATRRAFVGAIAFHLAASHSALCASTDPDTDALLDECVAGCDANLTLIEYGTATYKITNVDKRGGPARASELKVTFKGGDRRFESHVRGRIDGDPASITDYAIQGSDERIHYRPPLDGSRAPRGNIVVISPRKGRRWAPMEPRQQLHQTWIDPPSFGERVRYMRANAEATLTARRTAGGLIEVSFQPPVKETRGIYWLSPDHGYAVVRAKEWTGRWSGSDPSSTYEATFVKANSGAFVVSRRHERDFVPEGDALKLFRDEVVFLTEIDLVSPPRENAFGLEGLNLPIGATIHDRVRGRDYEYGVPAVDESQIQMVEPSGPMSMRSWLNTFNTVVSGAVLLWVGKALGRWHCGRQRRDGMSKAEV